jgi:large subunit ribosomal protein L14e
VIIDVLDDNYVMIEGQTRRKKCNIMHLEPLTKVLKVKKNASHEEVAKALKEIGVEVVAKKSKQKIEKPLQTRKGSEAKAVETKKPSAKKAKK